MVEVHGLPADVQNVTQGHTWREAELMAVDLIAIVTDTAHTSIEVRLTPAREIVVELPPEVEEALAARAEREGRRMHDLALDAIREANERADRERAARAIPHAEARLIMMEAAGLTDCDDIPELTPEQQQTADEIYEQTGHRVTYEGRMKARKFLGGMQILDALRKNDPADAELNERIARAYMDANPSDNPNSLTNVIAETLERREG